MGPAMQLLTLSTGQACSTADITFAGQVGVVRGGLTPWPRVASPWLRAGLAGPGAFSPSAHDQAAVTSWEPAQAGQG